MFVNISYVHIQKIKVDLEAHSRPVSSCLDQIRQVVLTGGNVLSSEEVSTLEKNGRSLKTRFDKASDRTERMVKRLNAARDELVKFKLVVCLHFARSLFLSLFLSRFFNLIFKQLSSGSRPPLGSMRRPYLFTLTILFKISRFENRFLKNRFLFTV